MILNYENFIRGVITRAIHHYVEAIQKNMHNHDEYKKSSYISYLEFNNQYGLALSQLLP